MTPGQWLVSASKSADAFLGRMSRLAISERPGLITVLFHNVFRNENDLRNGLANPLEEMTLERFKAFLAVWRNAGYQFVSVREIIDGLDPQGRYILISFDDGYRSILDILPVLERFRTPAVLFATSANIMTGSGFWSDTVYREEMARQGSAEKTGVLIEELKGKGIKEIEQFINERYGSSALKPRGDIDRPLTRGELATLSRNPLIEIGNHTANHLDLTACTEDNCFRQIDECQKSLEKITGQRPVAIAYPYGRFTDSVLRATQKAGLRIGFTCEEGKNRLPLVKSPLQLKRYNILGTTDQREQCERFRSDIAFCWPAMKCLLISAIRIRDLVYIKKVFISKGWVKNV